MPSRVGECVYCGDRVPLTKDHIPPACLFGRPRPNLIKVPSCTRCNTGASDDDEYLKTMLSLRYDLAGHKDVSSIRPSTLRGLAKPAKVRFRDALFRTLTPLIIYGPDGKPIRTLRTYDVQLERLYRVVRRITCGLFHWQSGRRLDAEYGVGVLGDQQIEELDSDTREEFIQYLANAKKVIFGADVFSFQGFRSATDPMITGWRFLFYDKVEFLAATLPLGALE